QKFRAGGSYVHRLLEIFGGHTPIALRCPYSSDTVEAIGFELRALERRKSLCSRVILFSTQQSLAIKLKKVSGLAFFHSILIQISEGCAIAALLNQAVYDAQI